VERPSGWRRLGERRRLWDRRAPAPRRSGADRRRGERRRETREVPSERRGTPDRRHERRRKTQDRRTMSIRRLGRVGPRETPPPFTGEQVAELQARFAAPGPVSCPACDGWFTLGPGTRRGAHVARRVMCLGCGRAAIVPDCRAARVIVVDRRSAVRDELHGTLTGAGHQVIEAADAAVALLAYQTVPADVVFIGALPRGRMDAPEFLRQLRRVFPEARVVAVVGQPAHGGVIAPAVEQELGAVRTIRMPLSGALVLRTLEEARP
jgi:CheY-like chemotaxis protein